MIFNSEKRKMTPSLSLSLSLARSLVVLARRVNEFLLNGFLHSFHKQTDVVVETKSKAAAFGASLATMTVR